MPLANGTRLGPYEIQGAIGAGGMGEVYRARDSRLGRDVAIKILPAQTSADADAVARLEREARLVAAVSHSAILTIHDVGQESGRFFVVTELLDGETLRTRLASGPLPWRRGLDYAITIASALAAAHARGIVHRDLKPENIFCTADGAVKILDFGVAKFVAPADSSTTIEKAAVLTEAGAAVGTIAYMAPEQLEGRAVDHRTDQFAFGVVLHEMLTGTRPFKGATTHETVAAILRDEPPGLASVRPELPPALSRITSRCLAKDPQGRYAATTDLALALEDVRRDADSGSTAVEQRPGPRSRRTIPWIAATLAVAAVVIAAAVWNSRTPPPPPAATPTPAADGVRAVAVLPFSVIGDAEPYLADGITEAVTRELGRIEQTRVIASNTAFAYRGRTEGFRQIGRELGIGLVVRGSVQRVGDRVRINAALVETEQESTLWSDRYDRAAADVLGVQDEIAWQVASKLAANFGRKAPARPSPSSSTNPEAYDAFLRGFAHFHGRLGIGSAVSDTESRLTAAAEEYERAVSLDPNFALARASLASVYTQRFFYTATDPEFEKKAFIEIEKALAINPDQAEAYLARGQLIWNFRNGFPHERAIADLKRAIANNPNLAEAHVELGKVYYHIGLIEKAIAENEEALKLDPLADVAHRRRIGSMVDGRMLQPLRDELARNGSRWRADTRVTVLMALDQPELALKEIEDGLAARGKDGERNLSETEAGQLALLYASLNRPADAQRALVVAKKLAVNPTGLSDIHHTQFAIGCTLALLGRRDEALVWLTKAANEGYPSYPRFSTEPDLSSLKGHPGFDALLERLRKDHERWRATL